MRMWVFRAACIVTILVILASAYQRGNLLGVLGTIALIVGLGLLAHFDAGRRL